MDRFNVLRLGSLDLIIIGDSIGRELHSALKKLLDLDHPPREHPDKIDVTLNYVELKPRPRPSRTEPLESLKLELESLRESRNNNKRGEAVRPLVLVLNPASLWWVAYGKMEDYRWVIKELLPLLEQVATWPQTEVST